MQIKSTLQILSALVGMFSLLLMAVAFGVIDGGTGEEAEGIKVLPFAAGLVLLVSASLIFFIARGISVRLTKLAAFAEKMVHEQPGHRIPVSGNDEISRITSSFNEISEYLAVTYREMHEAAESYRDLSSRLATGDAIKSAMLSTALDAIVTIDEAGMVHDFNTAAEALFGYSRDEAMGKEMAGLIVPEAYREAHRSGMAHWKATGEANVFGIRIEIEAQNKNGDIFPIELAITPLGLENQTYFTGFIRDITEKKKAEAELRLAASAFDSREGIFITDAKSRIIRANQALLEMTGFSTEEILNKEPSEVMSFAAEPAASASGLWAELLSSEQKQGEIYVVPKDGDAYPGWMSISTVHDDAGSATHHVAHVIDMTERKRFEQALESAREEAESANRAKSQFLANMSHEIRTPLNAIINLNSMLLDSALSAEQQNLARAAHKGGKALSTLVNDILDFSKIEAGKLRLTKRPFNLRKLVLDLDALFRPQALSQGLEFVIAVGDGIPEWISGDETRLRQVLVNLLGNGLKFTESGRVELTVDPARPVQSGNPEIKFRVRDTGIGVSPEDAVTIFDEFSQVDGSLTRRHSGSGLGLTISERLIKKMGGEIHYEAAPDVGSIFWFQIPLETAEEPEIVERPDFANLLSDARILVAEDSHANQLVAKALLEKAGCIVTLVDNGQEAVDMVLEKEFDAILMDMSMPVMDGLQATRRIRELGGSHSSVPVIAMTANVFAEDRAQCLEAGMSDFVAKPVVEYNLMSRLAHWLDPDRELKTQEVNADATFTSHPLLDQDVLVTMEKETSAELMAKVIEIFIEETRLHLEVMQAAGESIEPSTLVAESHAIKSSAGTFGAARLHEISRQVESLAREGKQKRALRATKALFDVGFETIQAFEQKFSTNDTDSIADK